MRRLSESIYNALCGAITCSCPYPHSIGLQLAHREAVMLPGDIEEKVAQKFGFCITLKIASEKETVLTSQHNKESRLMDHWKNFAMRLTVDNKSPPNALPLKVSDLCEVVGRGPKTTAVKCYGYILDTERKFILSPINDETGTHKHITLRQAIRGDISDLPPFGYEERLRVALALSVGILHLHGTTWLAQVVTLDNIVFMIENEKIVNQPASLYQPFLVKGIPDTYAHQVTAAPTSPKTRTHGSAREINTALLALGALLIQIMIGRIDDELGMTGVMDISSIISRQERGSQLEGEVRVNGGMNYAAAVTWCLGSMYAVADLQNDGFCQNFYEAIIRRLEDDLEVITNA